jgi:transcriptional regulator with XRE-family HTH domain
MIGERLKTARLAAGLSQRDLATRLGVSAMAISKYERGEITPSSSVLVKLSHELQRRVDYFLRPTRSTISAPAYRRQSTMSGRAEAALRAQVESWVDRYVALEQLVGDVPDFDPAVASRDVVSLDDAERAAEELRSIWRLGLDPIEDLVDVLETHGVRVGFVDGHPKVDALTFWIDEVVPFMAVKRGVSGDRARFSLAHELGHLVMRVRHGLDAEKAAMRFAGAFLVPAEAAYFELGRTRHSLSNWELSFLKCKYGMSMKAWVHRAADLGIISERAARQLYMWLAPYRKDEPGPKVPLPESNRLCLLALRALTENIVSSERASELYGGPLPNPESFADLASGVRC